MSKADMYDDDRDDLYETQMYYDREPAETAVNRLHEMGYGRNEIGVMMEEKTRERAFAAVTNIKGGEGVAAGATIGGILGAIIVGLTATGSVVATGGLAAPLVAGPLVAALAGLGAGAVSGGIIGGLIGLGIGEARAKEYEKGLRNGGILIAVKPKSHAERERVRETLAYERPTRTFTGEIEPSVDYVSELDDDTKLNHNR